MLTTKTKTAPLNYCTAEVGQDIGLQEGTAMIQRYRELNTEETVYGHLVGRNIIEQILAQPNCAGLNIYYALNHLGQRQLVFIGADANGRNILQFSKINAEGKMKHYQGIVADRTTSNDFEKPSKPGTKPGISADDFTWEI
jgi:hypothetical protein